MPKAMGILAVCKHPIEQGMQSVQYSLIATAGNKKRRVTARLQRQFSNRYLQPFIGSDAALQRIPFFRRYATERVGEDRFNVEVMDELATVCGQLLLNTQ